MSLRPGVPGEVPAETVRVARAAFPKGCLAVRVRDVLGPVFTDVEFAGLFSGRGRPAASPGRLAMVLVLQFAEGMSDRQAAHAVRSRIDWKYALGLELTDPGFDFSVLSEFRGRLIAGGVEAGVLDAVLESVSAAGLLKAGGRQRSDATHVLAAVREVNRLESVVEAMRAALNALAVAAPQWLAERTPPEWFDRYSARPEDTKFPSRWAARLSHAEQVGQDGMTLLQAVWSVDAPAWLRELPAVEFLRRMWVQEYQVSGGEVSWRKPKDCPPGQLRIRSAYDPDARNGAKRDRAWCGYKVHLTETCEPDAPHLITEVITTTAATADVQVTDQIHDALARRDLLPDVHLVDAGYVDAAHLVAARRDHGIELVGPVGANTGWQAAANNGYSIDAFAVDWDNKQVTCPNGRTSRQWQHDGRRSSGPVIRARFSPADCRPCPSRDQCTRGVAYMGREITLRHRDEHEALRTARLDQQTDPWKQRYKHRAGIEGTISQGVRAFGLRRSRYRGHPKTHLQHLLTAAGMNLTRLDAWLTGTPLAPTRTSHFAALRPTG
ncbi:IS1182 family transposase [Streptomyces sp. NBC_00341]|uniref:IS1182 family transposase n=1 Tax=unclassified Streptomyces TaxID=2593676 RepID=UPI002E2833A4|nr:IS1182 family transposase [Streptomyces sp. NBC_00304]WRZ10452.1 IS1182 family transposase [Streptomyces sp. NBC_00341]WRZ14167.1 IS1182 family transposase [Streptomyces sp. NBC_00341]